MWDCLKDLYVPGKNRKDLGEFRTIFAVNQVSEARGAWRTRALSTKVNAIRARIQRGLLDLQFMPTKEQRADGLTKCGGVNHNKLMREHFDLVTM